MQAFHLVVFCLVLFCTLKLASPMPWTSSEKARPVGNWTIKDSKGKICQRMQFGASYTVSTFYHPPKKVVIDPSRARVEGDCNAHRSFIVFLDYLEPRPSKWWFKMSFNRTDTAYNLTSLNISWVAPSGNLWFSLEDPRNYWNRCVTLGMAYNCTTPLVQKYPEVTVEIWGQHVQPYAEYAKGAFGPNQNCTDKPPAKCGNHSFYDVPYDYRKETKALSHD